MKKFRGNNPIAVEILNNLCELIERYKEEDKELEGILYLGRKELYAIFTIAPEDSSINRNLQTDELELWGFPIVKVLKDSYAALAVSKIWRR